jgi:hypothetical protein
MNRRHTHLHSALSLASGLLLCLPGLTAAQPPLPAGPSPSPAAAATSQAATATRSPERLATLLAQYDLAPQPLLIPAINAAAAQYDAVHSRLFWYTSLSEAKAAAQAQSKPIVYLRLLGNLTDEYSCANSRFFRTVLYTNPAVAAHLREKCILIWESERPVPIATIDFGDGRTLKRTLTGNSVHYILSPTGQVIDVLPGLFDHVRFLSVLQAAGPIAVAAPVRPTLPAAYLRSAESELLTSWEADSGTALLQSPPAKATANSKPPAALDAAPLAASKARGELAILRAMTPELTTAFQTAVSSADDKRWQSIAARHAAEATLDPASIALIARQNPSRAADPAAFKALITEFQNLLALDTARNNYILRRQVLSWLRQTPQPPTLEQLNTRIYAELFLTPRSDPWLGLLPESSYSALTQEGCHLPATSPNSADN